MKSILLVVLIWGVAAAQDADTKNRSSSLPSAPGKTKTWQGSLVDAGCSDRSIVNLKRSVTLGAATPPEQMSTDKADATNGAANQNGAVAAKGVTVDEKTAQAERSDAMKVHTQDHLTRQMDPSCAINGNTSAFALLLGNGTLLNLDAGGNTKATQMIQSSPRGMAILNGKASGEKPNAVVKAGREGDELHVTSIRLQ